MAWLFYFDDYSVSKTKNVIFLKVYDKIVIKLTDIIRYIPSPDKLRVTYFFSPRNLQFKNVYILNY